MFFMITTNHLQPKERRLQLVVAVPATSYLYVFGEHAAEKDPENLHLSPNFHR
jgi:hypothetical protein